MNEGAGYPQRIITLENSVEFFENLGFSRKLPANTTFISPGDKLKCCYFIKSGIVIGYELSRNGSVREYDVMLNSSLLGETFIIMDTPCPVYFKTVKDTELICIDKADFMRALSERPEVNRLVLQSLSTKFLAAMDEVRQAGTYSAAWRICNLLKIFADKHGTPYDGKILISQKISQQMMSNLLGLNRITTVRVIKTLKELQIVEQVNGLYCIRDMDRLKEYMEILADECG